MANIRKLFFCFMAILIMIAPCEKNIASGYSIYSMPADLTGQILIQNFQPPAIMSANNQYYLLYDIFVTNFQGEAIKLTSFKIDDANKHTVITEFKDDNLAKITRLVGPADPEKNSLVFNPGVTKIIYLSIPFTTKDSIPDSLTHSISFVTNADNKLSFSASAKVSVNKNYASPILGKPLHGDNWVASGGPSNNSHHRLAYLITNNQVIFGERYAIDFVKTSNKGGLTYQGDKHKNESYYAYGQSVLAVADGRIAKIRDGIPENIPNSDEMAVPFSMKVGPGNYIVLDIGQGLYAFYAHLIPGSIKVKEGDIVKKGQVIGNAGNSGHTIEPHLHFEITTSSTSLVEANSVPYVFDQFYKRNADVTMAGKFKIVKEVKILDDSLQGYKNQLMLQNWVVKLDDGVN